MAFVHFYELWKRIPRRRRRALVSFIYELKKQMGGKHHVHVGEMLENCEEDYLFIEVDNTNEKFNEILNDVYALCDKHSIPRNNVFIDGNIEIGLYTDY